jgi:N utilization substance protein B
MIDKSEPKLSHRFESARAARVAAVQALFQVESNKQAHLEVVKEFQEHRLPSDDYPYLPNADLFNRLVTNAFVYNEDIESIIIGNMPSEWAISDLDPVLKADIIIAVGELMHKPESIPAPVIVSEYVCIAKYFCGEKEAGFANRLLDQVAIKLGLQMSANKI